MHRVRVLINGGNGQVACAFNTVRKNFPQLEVLSLSRQEHDITMDSDRLRQAIAEISPDYYINTAAYTNVDMAETSGRESAQAINNIAVQQIATICAELNIPVIHFSSDYVYHNKINRPLLESDPLTPRGQYAYTKQQSEQYFQALDNPYLIFRISWVYSPYGKNFVKTMYQLLASRSEINVVNDQIGSPCYAMDLAQDVLSILLRDSLEGGILAENRGIYNYTQLGTASWYDIVIEMKEILNSKTQVNPVSTDFFPREAIRPSYSVMNLTKIKKTFNLDLRHWKKALVDCVKILDQNRGE